MQEMQQLFSQQWGERWERSLAAALRAPTCHVALLNAFLPCQPSPQQLQLPGATPLPLPASAAPLRALRWQPEADAPGGGGGYPPPGRDPATGLATHYWLDPASLLPPLALGVAPGLTVLDMCAAPGGKSLALAQLLFGADGGGGGGGEAGLLVCNELDAVRRGRLSRVLREYLPAAAAARVRVTPHDAARHWAHCEQGAFDAVLLDAPCSSDRHCLQQAAARADGAVPRAHWSARRCRRLAGEQARLLAAGLRALRPGGLLAYSTCRSAPQVAGARVAAGAKEAAGARTPLGACSGLG